MPPAVQPPLAHASMRPVHTRCSSIKFPLTNMMESHSASERDTQKKRLDDKISPSCQLTCQFKKKKKNLKSWNGQVYAAPFTAAIFHAFTPGMRLHALTIFFSRYLLRVTRRSNFISRAGERLFITPRWCFITHFSQRKLWTASSVNTMNMRWIWN